MLSLVHIVTKKYLVCSRIIDQFVCQILYISLFEVFVRGAWGGVAFRAGTKVL